MSKISVTEQLVQLLITAFNSSHEIKSQICHVSLPLFIWRLIPESMATKKPSQLRWGFASPE
jgi:hypothetical protein